MDKTQLLSYWNSFSDDLAKPVSVPDLKVLDQVAGFFSPGSFYYYLLNFPKFKVELVSANYEQLTGLSSQNYTIEQWLESAHPEDLEHIQKCEEVAEKFLFQYLEPEQITEYKVSYNYRRKNAEGSYQNNLHQAVALNLSTSGSIGHVLGIEASIEHISTQPANTVSFIHLTGGNSFINVSTTHPTFQTDEHPEHPLTHQELNVMRLISFGFTNDQIANRLSISIHTVRTHRSNILKKGDTGNMTAMVSEFIRKGII